MKENCRPGFVNDYEWIAVAPCVFQDKTSQMCGEILDLFVSATFSTKNGYLNISLQLDMGSVL